MGMGVHDNWYEGLAHTIPTSILVCCTIQTERSSSFSPWLWCWPRS